MHMRKLRSAMSVVLQYDNPSGLCVCVCVDML